MKQDTKRKLVTLVEFSLTVIYRSLRDLPKILFGAAFVLFLFFPENVTLWFNHLWQSEQALTDNNAVAIGKIISNFLWMAWMLSAFVHFFMSINALADKLRDTNRGASGAKSY